MPLSKKLTAEFIGTFWLVLGGCGSAVLAAGYPDVGIGWLGVSLAFGLTVLTMVYAIGHISGCHLNPAVSIGLWAGGRFPAKELGPYIVVQVVGAATGKADAMLRPGGGSPVNVLLRQSHHSGRRVCGAVLHRLQDGRPDILDVPIDQRLERERPRTVVRLRLDSDNRREAGQHHRRIDEVLSRERRSGIRSRRRPGTVGILAARHQEPTGRERAFAADHPALVLPARSQLRQHQ